MRRARYEGLTCTRSCAAGARLEADDVWDAKKCVFEVNTWSASSSSFSDKCVSGEEISGLFWVEEMIRRKTQTLYAQNWVQLGSNRGTGRKVGEGKKTGEKREVLTVCVGV